MEPRDVVELRMVSRRPLLSTRVKWLAAFTTFALFGILAAVLTEPAHVALVDSFLLVSFPLAMFARRR
jgi:hypothetical protein